MLAILQIEMTWYKKDRTPEGAVLRQKYYRPMRIEDGVKLEGTGVFYRQCAYCQVGNSVLSEEAAARELDENWQEENSGKAFTGTDEWAERRTLRSREGLQRYRGSFYRIEDLDIPCIAVSKEEGACYRVKWYDYGRGMPRRWGGNEDLYRKGSRLAGQPNTLNETAFILREGESGMLKYNYRYTSYEGQWYRCYYIYAVNERTLTRNIFLRNYDYEYSQMAHLF